MTCIVFGIIWIIQCYAASTNLAKFVAPIFQFRGWTPFVSTIAGIRKILDAYISKCQVSVLAITWRVGYKKVRNLKYNPPLILEELIMKWQPIKIEKFFYTPPVTVQRCLRWVVQVLNFISAASLTMRHFFFWSSPIKWRFNITSREV